MTGHRRPAWRLVVDGQDFSPEGDRRVLSLVLTEKRGSEADELEIQLSDHDGRLSIPPKGALVTLSLGWRRVADASLELYEKGSFKVDETTHQGAPDTLSIRARSADLTTGYRRRRAGSWSATTVGAVLAEVAGRNGLQAAVSPDKAAIPLTHLEQRQESDAALVARLGRRFDAVATVKAGRLIFTTTGAGVTPSGLAIPAGTLDRQSGDRHSWKTADRGSYSGVVAEWHDRAGAERREVVVGSEDNARRLGRTYASEDAALRAARAEMNRIDRGKAEFSLTTAMGRPDLYPERRLRVAGFKPQIDAADWLVAEVRHSVAGEGFTTALQLELGGPA